MCLCQCLCFQVLWSKIWMCMSCECFANDKQKAKTKKKKKKEKKIRSTASFKLRTEKKQPLDSPLQTVSEIDDSFLFDKYMIRLPKDNFSDPNEWLHNIMKYEITGTLLGSGGFGQVFLARKHLDITVSDSNDTQLEIAVKVLEIKTEPTKKIKGLSSLKNELFIAEELMKQIDKAKHNHIIKFYDRFIIEMPRLESESAVWKAYFFMELANGDLESELKKNSGPFNDSTAKRYFSQIVYAMSYIHGLNIAHRDLKLENCLLVRTLSTDPNDLEAKVVKVTDFGLSRVQYKESTGMIETKKTGGTLWYKAPEILMIQTGITQSEFDAFKADVWALGVCLFRMSTGEYPFDFGSDLKKIIQLQQKFRFGKHNSKNNSMDKMAKDLIERMLTSDPDIRPGIGSVKSHLWLEGEISLTVTQNT